MVIDIDDDDDDDVRFHYATCWGREHPFSTSMDMFGCYPWKLFQLSAMENDEYLPFDYLPINGHPWEWCHGGWYPWLKNVGYTKRLSATEIQQWC